MNIVGLDSLVFGVDDVSACCQYLVDYGLLPREVSEQGGFFEATDGTSIEIRHRCNPDLPPELASGSMLRKTVYGVADIEALQAIAEELAKDREVVEKSNGVIEAYDDSGFALAFRVTVRKPLDLGAQISNSPISSVTRAVNDTAVTLNPEITASSLSHAALFVPDGPKAEAFYQDRLGFRVVDRFTDAGPFMRPAGCKDHHTMFLIETPPEMQGVEHFTFHMANPSELIQAGKRFQDKGYESFWGPGRHIFGSNWFWYFNSPMGVHVEYDADMDLHDDSWVPRETTIGQDTSQIFNFKLTENWLPGGLGDA